MTPPLVNYFAYGSNMWRPRLESRVGPVLIHGHAVLAGFAHRFNKLGADGTAKGNIEPVDEGEVHGVLYRLHEPQVTLLRRYEGGYHERGIEVQFAGSLLSAITYVAELPRECPPPTPEYLAHYRRGMVQNGLPAEYLSRILG